VQQQAKIVMKSIHKSVEIALDKKKRLGQYAVVWENKKVSYLFKDKENARGDNQ